MLRQPGTLGACPECQGVLYGFGCLYPDPADHVRDFVVLDLARHERTEILAATRFRQPEHDAITPVDTGTILPKCAV